MVDALKAHQADLAAHRAAATYLRPRLRRVPSTRYPTQASRRSAAAVNSLRRTASGQARSSLCCRRGLPWPRRVRGGVTRGKSRRRAGKACLSSARRPPLQRRLPRSSTRGSFWSRRTTTMRRTTSTASSSGLPTSRCPSHPVSSRNSIYSTFFEAAVIWALQANVTERVWRSPNML